MTIDDLNRILIAALSAAGLYISIYFTLVYYGVIQAENSIMPAFSIDD